MKKFIILILLLFICCIVSQAQKDYSQENLEKLSQEELDVYLNKAMRMQKSGKTFTTIGVAALGVTVLSIPLDSSGGMIAAATVIFVGIPALVTTTVGISRNSKGKKRAERINSISNTTFNDITIDLKPHAQYDQMTHNYQPVVTLRVRF